MNEEYSQRDLNLIAAYKVKQNILKDFVNRDNINVAEFLEDFNGELINE